ncbi:hypothetical protein C7H84_31610 [Burkholderia sp. Nafp2/4-1b]|nr:hypothetical protein C7H84_31610 [Burkholderia sp. Nafp2/4-1b]
MPQAWPSKPDGSLAAMKLDADTVGVKGPPQRAHAMPVASPPPYGNWQMATCTWRPQRGSPSAPGRESALSA